MVDKQIMIGRVIERLEDLGDVILDQPYMAPIRNALMNYRERKFRYNLVLKGLNLSN